MSSKPGIHKTYNIRYTNYIQIEGVLCLYVSIRLDVWYLMCKYQQSSLNNPSTHQNSFVNFKSNSKQKWEHIAQ